MRRALLAPFLSLSLACACAGAAAAAVSPVPPVPPVLPVPPPANVSADFIPLGPPEPFGEPLDALLTAVRAPALLTHVRYLASPALGGRGIGSRGLDAALEYVAATLALAGVPPLAAEGYFQKVPVVEISQPGGSVEVERNEGSGSVRRSFVHGVDCVLPGLAPRTVSAPVVFAGFGIREKSPARDDFAGLDVKGKAVLVLGGLPPGEEWKKPPMASRYAGGKDDDDRFEARLETARRLGAAILLVVEEGWAERLPGAGEEGKSVYRRLEADGGEDDRDAHAPLLVRVSPALARSLLGRDGATPLDDKPRTLTGTTLSLSITGKEKVLQGRNVVAVVAGSDPKLAEEAVVVGSHVDGVGETAGLFRPGADDSATGVAALLEMARALAASPKRPRRTVVFTFWTGEEEGHLGSGHWVRHPQWPLGRIAAYVNVDMIGHAWLPEEIGKLVAEARLLRGEEFLAKAKPDSFIEVGIPEWFPPLAPVLDRAARGTGLALHLDRVDGGRGGSDYRDFALRRVPFLRFFGNFFPGYHKAGDTVAAVDAVQVERVARLVLASTWLLAQR